MAERGSLDHNTYRDVWSTKLGNNEKGITCNQWITVYAFYSRQRTLAGRYRAASLLFSARACRARRWL